MPSTSPDSGLAPARTAPFSTAREAVVHCLLAGPLSTAFLADRLARLGVAEPDWRGALALMCFEGRAEVYAHPGGRPIELARLTDAGERGPR